MPQKEDVAVLTEKIKQKLSLIRRKILVLSGKGGVGKSTVACALSLCLAEKGERVGLLDVDIHGPSVPLLLGLRNARVRAEGEELLPVEGPWGVRVLSIGFLLESESGAVIWRGPLKLSLIRQFLAQGRWGELDWLIVDSPPGTGDEPLSCVQLIGKVDGAILVTTPQEVALADVRKAVDFCRKLEVPVLGVVENFSWVRCPSCGKEFPVFGQGGGQLLAREAGSELLSQLPLEPDFGLKADRGQLDLSGQVGEELHKLAEKVAAKLGGSAQ